MPNAKPCAAKRDCGAPKPKKEAGLRALAVQGRPAGEKRKRTLSKRWGPATCLPGVCGMAETDSWLHQAGLPRRWHTSPGIGGLGEVLRPWMWQGSR